MVNLIRPHVMQAKSSPASPTCAPIGVAYLAAAVKQAGYPVHIIDAVGEAPDKFVEMSDRRFTQQGLTRDEIVSRITHDASLIGISCMYSYEWPNVRGLVNEIRVKFPNARIVLGGEHATALPEFCLQDCIALDIVAMGEGEETLVELCNEKKPLTEISSIVFRDKSLLVQTPARKRIKAVDDIARPAWELFPIDRYLDGGYGRGVNRGRNMPMISSRGCPYRCTFCSNESMWGPQWISRKPELVVEEIKYFVEKYNISNFDFYDLTTIVNRTWTVNFCKKLIESGVNFTWQLASGTRSEAIDEEVAELLAKAGCANISYAPESGSKSVLKRIQKKIDLTKMKQSMRASYKNGIICKANILIGFPGETHKEIFETLKFCFEVALTGMHDLSVYPFSPYPGSDLYRQLLKDKRIPQVDDDYFFQLALSTEFGATPPSYSEHISTRMLGFYRLAGIAIFYATSYVIRPWRFFQLIKNTLSDTQETLLESVLHDKIVRRLKLKFKT